MLPFQPRHVRGNNPAACLKFQQLVPVQIILLKITARLLVKPSSKLKPRMSQGGFRYYTVIICDTFDILDIDVMFFKV